MNSVMIVLLLVGAAMSAPSSPVQRPKLKELEEEIPHLDSSRAKRSLLIPASALQPIMPLLKALLPPPLLAKLTRILPINHAALVDASGETFPDFAPTTEELADYVFPYHIYTTEDGGALLVPRYSTEPQPQVFTLISSLER